MLGAFITLMTCIVAFPEMVPASAVGGEKHHCLPGVGLLGLLWVPTPLGFPCLQSKCLQMRLRLREEVTCPGPHSKLLAKLESTFKSEWLQSPRSFCSTWAHRVSLLSATGETSVCQGAYEAPPVLEAVIPKLLPHKSKRQDFSHCSH